MNQEELHKFVLKNHGKIKNKPMAKLCNVSENQIETVKTNLIREGLIKPTRQRIDEIIKRIVGRPKAEIGCKDGEARRTVILNKETYTGIKALAFLDRKDIKVLAREIFDEYLKSRAADLPEALKLYESAKDKSVKSLSVLKN